RQVLDDTLRFYAEAQNLLGCMLYTKEAISLGTYSGRLNDNQAHFVQEKAVEFILKDRNNLEKQDEIYYPEERTIQQAERGRWAEIGLAYSIVRIFLSNSWFYTVLIDYDVEGGVKK
ncbi:MAG: hypothetical protein ACFFBD_00710, partial [Candidatus Hodarchaeota archaeon]